MTSLLIKMSRAAVAFASTRFTAACRPKVQKRGASPALAFWTSYRPGSLEKSTSTRMRMETSSSCPWMWREPRSTSGVVRSTRRQAGSSHCLAGRERVDRCPQRVSGVLTPTSRSRLGPPVGERVWLGYIVRPPSTTRTWPVIRFVPAQESPHPRCPPALRRAPRRDRQRAPDLSRWLASQRVSTGPGATASTRTSAQGPGHDLVMHCRPPCSPRTGSSCRPLAARQPT